MAARAPRKIGKGLADTLAAGTYHVDAACDRLSPHLWDESRTCLPVGATEMWIDGHHAGDLTLDDTPPDKPPGRWVVLRSIVVASTT